MATTSPLLFRAADGGLGDFVTLLKRRVAAKAVFTAPVDLLVAAGNVEPRQTLHSIVTIAVGADGAGGIVVNTRAEI